MIQSGSESGYHLSVDVKIAMPGQRFTTVHEIRDEWREIVKNSSLSSELLQELD